MPVFQPLKQGIVGIFAPAGPFSEDRFQAGCQALEKQGLELRFSQHLRAKEGFFAGNDAQRLAGFHQLLADPEVEVLMAARGGYGVTRILANIDFELLAQKPKAIVGFSDLTALHHCLQAKAQLPSIHGPVVTQFGELDGEQQKQLVELLRSPFSAHNYQGSPSKCSGSFHGPLSGGCLSVLTALAGTPHLSIPEGAILLLEEVAEAPYRIDRMLTQLIQTGQMSRVQAVVVGDVVQGHARRDHEPDAKQVIQERLDSLNIPVSFDFPFGHGDRNLAMILGAQASLDLKSGRLEVLLPS